jgi:hypothetical protein
VAGQNGLESADAGPGGANGAGNVDGGFEDSSGEAVEGGDGRVVEFAIGGDGEEG